MTHGDRWRRLDLHNTSIDFAAASVGRCGYTHLATGRVCQLPHRHPGSCELGERLTPRRSTRIYAGLTATAPPPAASTCSCRVSKEGLLPGGPVRTQAPLTPAVPPARSSPN
jgi:hypothetical protein